MLQRRIAPRGNNSPHSAIWRTEVPPQNLSLTTHSPAISKIESIGTLVLEGLTSEAEEYQKRGGGGLLEPTPRDWKCLT